MTRYWLMMVVGFAGTLVVSAQQQPQPKGPMLPPINPALAKLETTIPNLHGPGFAIAYGKDLLVVACENGTIQGYKKQIIADVSKGGKAEPEVYKGHSGPVRSVQWHGGPTMVSAGTDKKIVFWKMPEGKAGPVVPVDFRVRATALSEDGKTYAASGENDFIQLFDVVAGKATTKLTDKMDWTLALAFSADGKQLLSGDMLGVVRLWDVASGKKLKELPAKPTPAPKTPPDPVETTCVAFAPDGKSFLLGDGDGKIHLINLADGKIVRTYVGHTGPITGIAFHPTGTLMVSVSKDRTVKLWNPAAVQPLKSLDGHGAWIEGVVFIDQATKLATVSADQTVRIWDLAEAPKKK